MKQLLPVLMVFGVFLGGTGESFALSEYDGKYKTTIKWKGGSASAASFQCDMKTNTAKKKSKSSRMERKLPTFSLLIRANVSLSSFRGPLYQCWRHNNMYAPTIIED